jgi:hypothetical protein
MNMNTSIHTPSPFEQNRADAWRKRRDLHFADWANYPDSLPNEPCRSPDCFWTCKRCERWLNEEIEVSPKDFALTIAFGGLVCFVGAGFWYGVFGLLRWLSAFIF